MQHILYFDNNNNPIIDGEYVDLRNVPIVKFEFKLSCIHIVFKAANKFIRFNFTESSYLNIETENFCSIENEMFFSDISYKNEGMQGYGFIIEDDKPVFFDSYIFDKIKEKLYFQLETKNGLTFYFDSKNFFVDFE